MGEVPTHLKDPCPSRLAEEQALPSQVGPQAPGRRVQGAGSWSPRRAWFPTAFGSTTSQRTTITTMTARSTSSVSVRTLPPPVCGTGDGRQAGAGGRIGPVSAKGPVSGCSRHSPLTQDTEFRGWGMVRPAVTCRSPPCSYWLRGHTSSGLARGRRGGVPLPGAATSCCLQRS